MANILGRRTEGLQTALHTPNILADIVFVDGNLEEAKFLALVNQIPMGVTYNKKFSFYEDTWLPAKDTVNGAVSGTTATTIKVDTPAAYIPEQIWMNQRTKEHYFILQTSDSAGTITVERAVGYNSTDSTGTAAAAILDEDVLIRVGPSMGEVSRRQIAQSTTPTEVFNYAEKKRWEIDMSDVQRKTKHITGDDWERQLDKALKQARKDLNGWLYVSERNKLTLNSQTQWMSGGVDFFIASNILSVSGTLHEYAFNAWLVDEAMRYGPGEKNMMCSSRVIRAINEMASDKITIQRVNLGTKDLVLGVQVLSYLSPTGQTLHLMEDRFLSEMMPGQARVLDMSVISLRHFSGGGLDGRLKLEENTQDVDADNYAATILGDIGLEVGPEKHHGKITGVTSGAAGRAVT